MPELIRPRPYIGLTGVVHPADGAAIVRQFWSVVASPAPSHKLMIGVLISRKTLTGVQANYPHRYPHPDAIAGICTSIAAVPSSAPDTMTLLHVSGLKQGPEYLPLLRMARLCGGRHCHGLQINGWADPDALRQYRKLYPSDIIVKSSIWKPPHLLGGGKSSVASRKKKYLK